MQKFVNVVIPPLPQAFTYGISNTAEQAIEVGDRVEVSFGKRRASGFVVAEKSRDELAPETLNFEIKYLDASSKPQQCFRQEDLEFYRWVADYYGDALADVIDVAVPHAVPAKKSRQIRVIENFDSASSARGKLQSQIIDFVSKQTEAIDYNTLLSQFPGSSAAIKKLTEKGLIEVTSFDRTLEPKIAGEIPSWTKSSVVLSAQQTEAVSKISESMDAKKSDVFLLHGVTGSGKTEVYIEVIQKALDKGLGALVLVPEIALTPQLIDRFRARLGEKIVVLHSALSKRERWESWSLLLERENLVAIGARSGVFAPIKNLSVIVVDEEHDHSYKQSEGLRYNARDVAVMRGKFQNTPVILGSATPSLESFHNAVKKKYFYQPLSTRHAQHNRLSVELVDMNKVKFKEMVSKNVSPQLFQAVQQALANNEQIFMLYNRRGFASYLQCEDCEAVISCPNCSVTLTYHQDRHTLVCHYCNLSQVPLEFCSICRTVTTEGKAKLPGKLAHRGAGTERIYDELKVLFPDVKIDRLDRDAVSDLDTYRKILNNVRSGETKILVGTQMIAKGHDLPGVTLVGIVDCDVGLHMPDFRAAERIFQLLTQAAGRAGRHEMPGKVVLQTRVPRHASLVMTERQDYIGFAKHELAIRKQSAYPPFTRLARIVASSTDKDEPGKLLNLLRGVTEKVAKDNGFAVTILGPACAPLEKLKAVWRWHLMLKSNSASQLVRLCQSLKSVTAKYKKIKVVFDIDPQEML